MTREEQIREAGRECEEVDNDFELLAFQRGAEWADKHPQSPWIPLDGKHKKPPYKRAIAVYYPLDEGTVDLVIRSKKTGTPLENGNYPDKIDEYGLPVIAISSHAALVCDYYSVRATMWMDIPEPTKEE